MNIVLFKFPYTNALIALSYSVLRSNLATSNNKKYKKVDFQILTLVNRL